jgi:hypothetical protein
MKLSGKGMFRQSVLPTRPPKFNSEWDYLAVSLSPGMNNGVPDNVH